MSKKKLKLSHLLRPHRGMLVLAFIAVLGEAATDLLEPWPLKIVFDYVFGTKHMPAWMSALIGGTFGLSKVAILHFAILAVIVIAVAGALSAYAEKYLTTSVGQWVMHDLRGAAAVRHDGWREGRHIVWRPAPAHRHRTRDHSQLTNPDT